MAFSAMELTEENLNFLERFGARDHQEHAVWFKALYELGIKRSEYYFIVIEYTFKEMAFVRDSFIVMTSDAFADKFVFVQNGSGFCQVELRVEI